MSREIAPQTDPNDMWLEAEEKLPEGMDICDQCGKDYPIEVMVYMPRSCIYLCIDCLDKLRDDR